MANLTLRRKKKTTALPKNRKIVRLNEKNPINRKKTSARYK